MVGPIRPGPALDVLSGPAASWFNGTRMFDVATGASRLIIRGSQRFIALSSSGDLAWAKEEAIGDSLLCTAALSDL